MRNTMKVLVSHKLLALLATATTTLLLAGCVAEQPGDVDEGDESVAEAEQAVVGAPCETFEDCDPVEYCHPTLEVCKRVPKAIIPSQPDNNDIACTWLDGMNICYRPYP